MFVFSRRVNESLLIGDDIVVTVVEIRGDKVRLGVETQNPMAARRKFTEPASDKSAHAAADAFRHPER